MKFISESSFAALTGTSTATVKSWAAKDIYESCINSKGIYGFDMDKISDIPEINEMNHSKWDEEKKSIPLRKYNSVELFAGGGGLALGMEKAGFSHVLLNEFETAACNTLRVNRPDWNIIEGDIRHIDFSPLRGKIDFVSGGFPCQAFSFAGKQGGFNDIRGTLFFELARAVKEIQPRVFLGENVKGLASHDGGKTFKTICNVIDELGYILVPPRILKAIMYQVPQKRERIILIAIRKDLADGIDFKWPSPYERVMTLRDAFFSGTLYDTDVPKSEGVSYPEKKKSVLSLVPEGGDWRDLPVAIAKEYMGGSWNLGGGKTGMARRLSLDEPSLTLTCAPAQKQTERCHPIETRPLSVREYARIQTFPDIWQFQGTISDKYKQIGNAVPVNLAWAIGRSVIRLLNDIEKKFPGVETDCSSSVAEIISEQSKFIFKKDKKNQTSTIEGKFKQLNLFDLFDDFSSDPIVNRQVLEPEESYGSKSFGIADASELDASIALVAYIGNDLRDAFEKGSAGYYYTGKRFPAKMPLSEIRYLIPYIKGKGIRDVYAIRKIRIGTKRGEVPKKDVSDLRLVFDIIPAGKFGENYQKTNLDIWRTFRFESIKEK